MTAELTGVRIATLHSVNRVIIESNFCNGLFNALLKPMLNPKYSVTIEECGTSSKGAAHV
ncbi:hypothetical protein [Rubellimicrobium arenae]|uniref:hypothetical protein n=1 Tax=Rubellimicrobium arenae TaxID=2817372 RepID=UPI003F6396C3